MSAPFKPQLAGNGCASVAQALAGREGFIEPKIDGWRGLAEIDSTGTCRLWGRKGAALTASAPEIAEALEVLPPNTILDGELATEDGTWGSTQSILGGGAKDAAWREPLRYFLFDVIRFDGNESGALPYRDRRPFLEKVFGLIESKKIILVPSFPADEETYQAMLEQQLEGGVVKLADSTCSPGARGAGWIKLKFEGTMDVVVIEIEEGGGKREGEAGTIHFGQYRDGVLVSRGGCGTGFGYGNSDENCGGWIWENRKALLGKVFEIGYGRGIGDQPRTPAFKRWRFEEKLPEECVWETIPGA